MPGTQSPIVAGTLYVLITFSIATWSLVVLKLWSGWRLAGNNRAFRESFWSARDVPAAGEVASHAEGTLAEVARAGYEVLRSAADTQQDLQHTGERRELIEAALRSGMRRAQRGIESGLTILASIGSTAPFVGLFGTVWGIMHALKDIGHAGTASLDVVAGPVGEALIATAVGIAVAVPAVLAYNWGLRRARLATAEMEDFATDFVRVACARWPSPPAGR